jgi:predicted glycoside hydrolase/deacetylase ChbG (UPF0249 family)
MQSDFNHIALANLLTVVFVMVMTRHVTSDEASQKKYLIIHADDAGMSHSVNRGTVDAMEKGIVSSASIMVPCPWFKEFAEYAKQHPEKDFGIHLTLNSEWDKYRWGPVADRKDVPSLVDPEGYLWDNVAQVASHAKAEEVTIELRAQIQRALNFGVPLSHLDTHMGAVVSRPDLVEVYIKLGIEFDLPVMMVRDLGPEYMQIPGFKERFPAMLSMLEEQKMPILDRLEQHYGGQSHGERRATYVETLKSIGPGVTQLIIHCGYDNEELSHITSSSARRDGDRRIFCEPEIRQLIAELDIDVVTWKQFREMQAK